MTLKTLLAKNRDGVSFTRKGLDYRPVNYKRGYFIALTDNVVNGSSQSAIYKIDNLARFLNLKRYFYGYWQDRQTAKSYLDLSIHTNNKQQALAVARTFRQKAVWDCRHLTSIYLTTGGGD